MKELINKRENKAITLIALVVTIVVLLILAGVTIVTLFGENGIITKAKTAEHETQKGVNNDIEDLDKLTEWMDSQLAPKTEKGEKVDKEIKYAKYTDSTSTEPAYIPGGYCVVKDSNIDTDEARKLNTIANGLVISDLAGDTLDNEPNEEGVRGNQFVWVPVNEAQFAKMYDATNKRANLYDFGEYNAVKNPPTLEEYSPTGIREPDVITGKADGTGTKYDADPANLDVITDFKVNEGETKTVELFKQYLQSEFDNMIASVKKYNGFYIGRYETGNLSSDDATTIPVVQKGNDKAKKGNWYYQYQQNKNMSKDKKNVVISMIWGCQWDRTTEWIAQTTENGYDLVVDSSAYGDIKTVQPTGSKIEFQNNHIYDLADYGEDWTIEAYHASHRVGRGIALKPGTGYYFPSISGRSVHEADDDGLGFGSRSTLYLKT